MTKVIVCRQCEMAVLAKDNDHAVKVRARHEVETDHYITIIRDVTNVLSDTVKADA